MRHLIVKTCLVTALALGFGGPVFAFAPLGDTPAPSLVVRVMDEEDAAVAKDLVPDETMEAPKGGAAKPAMEPADEGAGSGDVEEETIDRIMPDAPGAP